MEIPLDIDLFLLLEKKTKNLSHICSIEYMGLVLLLYSLQLNVNTYSTKNLPFWSSSYLATSITFFIIVNLFFSCPYYFCYVKLNPQTYGRR